LDFSKFLTFLGDFLLFKKETRKLPLTFSILTIEYVRKMD